MKTHEARIDATLHSLRADQNAMRVDIERNQKDIERTLKSHIWWISGFGLGLGALILGVAAYLG